MKQEVQPAPHEPATDDLQALLATLPPRIQKDIKQQDDLSSLLEVVLDLGRLPEARFAQRDLYLDSTEVTEEDIQYVVDRLSPFGDDNRAGIERTLHRLSAIRNRAGKIVGLTCRVGRAVFGTVRILEDLVTSGQSILLVGRPGVGKTTMLREMARVLADTAHKRVVIVDTSNEIAGDGDIPHPAIGKSRRMQVRTPALQHAVMIEAVENHMPEAIIVDEMGTEQEAVAARTIAERGVQLIATAHGNTLDNLLINPTLSDLVGGVQTVTLGDEEAHRRRTQKTILERKAPPTFDVLVEIQSWQRVAVHLNVAQTVDRLLRGQTVTPEVRWLDESGNVRRSQEQRKAMLGANVQGMLRPSVSNGGGAQSPLAEARAVQNGGEVASGGLQTRVHAYGVSRERLEQVALATGAQVQVVGNVVDADLVLTTKSHFRRFPAVLRIAEEQSKPVFVLRRNTPAQIASFLESLTTPEQSLPGVAVDEAMAEAQDGVERILVGQAPSVELTPQSSYVRRVQHQIAEGARLRSRSSGREPQRRVTIYRGRP